MNYRQLSPLHKDPATVGRLIKRQIQNNQHNQHSQHSQHNQHNKDEQQKAQVKTTDLLQQQSRQKQPQSIGINTSKLIGSPIHNNPQLQIKPVTQMNKGQHFKVTSQVYKIDYISKKNKSNKKLNVSEDKIDKWARESGMLKGSVDKRRESEKFAAGTIFRQKKSLPTARSASKQSGKYSYTSPQLPFINKIERNVKGFRNFIGESQKTSHNTESWHMEMPRRKQTQRVNISSVLNPNCDPEENQILNPPKKHPKNSRLLQLSSFVQEKNKQYQQPSPTESKEFSPTNNHTPQKQSTYFHPNLNAFEEGPLDHQIIQADSQFRRRQSHDYIYAQSAQSAFKVDLRTPVSRIKQLLIQSTSHLNVSFMIPEIFFHPPTHDVSAKQLHHCMHEIFNHVDLIPQIVSIKKYVNCVMMCDKKLCVLWSFNGKIYFGGWDRNRGIQGSSSRMLTEGNKHGMGMEWIPSRYIYYGEFKDNKKEGYGIMKKSNKQVYIGQWKGNQRDGWGKVFNVMGEITQNGEFSQGCFMREKES